MRKLGKKQKAEWLNSWNEAAALLRENRRQRAREIVVEREVMALNDASEAALRLFPPTKSSGLIEMQRIFAKARI